MRDTASIEGENYNCNTMLCHLIDQTHDNGARMISLVEQYIGHFDKNNCNLSFTERQDICQEVAIKLICEGNKMRDNCPRSWVYTVVRNTCISHIRKQTKYLSVVQASDFDEVDATTAGLLPLLEQDTNIDLMQKLDCLQKVFDKIESTDTGKADIAIYTQYAFGLSYLEISRYSERSVDAIGRRISLLKGRLKKLIIDCC